MCVYNLCIITALYIGLVKVAEPEHSMTVIGRLCHMNTAWEGPSCRLFSREKFHPLLFAGVGGDKGLQPQGYQEPGGAKWEQRHSELRTLH